MSPVWVWWNSVNIKPPSVRGRRTDCQGHWSQISVYASILPSFITVGGNNAKLIIQPLKKKEKKNKTDLLHTELRLGGTSEGCQFMRTKILLFFLFWFTFVSLLSTESLFLWWTWKPERGWKISKMSHLLLYLKSCVNYIHCKIFNSLVSCFSLMVGVFHHSHRSAWARKKSAGSPSWSNHLPKLSCQSAAGHTDTWKEPMGSGDDVRGDSCCLVLPHRKNCSEHTECFVLFLCVDDKQPAPSGWF